MKCPLILAIAVALVSSASLAPAQETAATSKIVAVDLFKNGLAIVKREATLGKPGVYVLDDVPTPIHGTFWIEAAGPVETLLKMRDVEVPVTETTPGNLQDDLGGKKVTVHFKGDKRAPVTGTVMKLKPAKGEEALAQPARFLMLQTAKGRTYVEASEVAAVEAEDAGGTVTRCKPRLLLTLGKTNKDETKVVIRYLTRGIAWAPSYKIDISDPKTLTLEQNALVRNELTDLKNAEMRLISGYPSVQFAHVRSPLAPRTSWAMFMQELNGHGGPDNNDYAGNRVVMQNVSFNPVGGDFPALGAIPTGEGVDLHYQPIGKRTLADGETLSLSIAKGKADYERIVEWLVLDNRNELGQYGGGRNRDTENDDSAWDALKFKNPLNYPMTTGPAMVSSGGEFNGQRTSYWVNAGEEMVLRVNKALSVRTRSLEHEVPAKEGRDLTWIGGRQFRKSTVEGELAVSNHRKEAISLVLRRRFSGELVQAEGSPKASLREEGVYSVNKRNELLWTIPLKAGEERMIKYTYSVLVPY